MHEKQGREPSDETHNTFRPALAYLLGEGSQQLNNVDGFTAARLIYDFLIEDSDEQIDMLYDIAEQSDEIAQNHLLQVLENIDGEKEKHGLREIFIKDLGDIIEHLSNPSLSLNAEAIRLAYTIKAWEIIDSVQFINGIHERLLAREMDIEEWAPLMKEKDIFLDTMRLDQEQAGINRPDFSKAILDFINTLDLHGFTGEKP